MYTILWVENGADKWDRLESTDEVKKLLDRLEQENTVSVGDVWIYGPEADNFASDAVEWLNNLVTK